LILPGGDAGAAELYHLDDDPNETKNLRRVEPERLRAMVREMEAQRALDPPGGN
jgi:hypothetical protein